MNVKAKFLFSIGLLGLVCLMLPGSVHANIVAVNSGSAVSGSAVTYLDSGFTSTDFSAPFTTADFTAAQEGTAASILTSTPSYIGSLPDGPGAVWIGTNPNAGTSTGDTALYAISFYIPSAVSAASFNLYYAVDNNLGENLPGIYINGTALPASGLCPTEDTSCFTQENTYSDADISSLLVPGENWLYLDAVNEGGPAGLIFSANIDYTPVAAPEPSSLLLLGTGLLALVGLGWRRHSQTAGGPVLS
jgi:hypothetical protein